MSHVDQYRSKGTCQTCRQPARVSGVGTVRRHRVASGNVCSGSGCLSLENATPMTDAETAEFMADLLRYADGA